MIEIHQVAFHPVAKTVSVEFIMLFAKSKLDARKKRKSFQIRVSHPKSSRPSSTITIIVKETYMK